jgi:arylsulfatase A-like enzyme
MISWPGKLPAGEVRHQMATACDWMPTIADLTGVERPDRRLDGRSIAKVIHSSDAESPHKQFHWQSGGGKNPQWAVRDGDWKLIGNPRDTSNKAPVGKGDARFLVNFAEDVSEMKNLAAAHPGVVKRLEMLHEAWVQDLSH